MQAECKRQKSGELDNRRSKNRTRMEWICKKKWWLGVEIDEVFCGYKTLCSSVLFLFTWNAKTPLNLNSSLAIQVPTKWMTIVFYLWNTLIVSLMFPHRMGVCTMSRARSVFKQWTRQTTERRPRRSNPALTASTKSGSLRRECNWMKLRCAYVKYLFLFFSFFIQGTIFSRASLFICKMFFNMLALLWKEPKWGRLCAPLPTLNFCTFSCSSRTNRKWSRRCLIVWSTLFVEVQ